MKWTYEIISLFTELKLIKHIGHSEMLKIFLVLAHPLYPILILIPFKLLENHTNLMNISPVCLFMVENLGLFPNFLL